ncbi:MAG TPA: universal stress protein [Actinophytocola sp.]|uniref:universal stress protein n=1 Tax=Actinophytocola sp. TaxID=1872138 RepID=UPI002E082F8C|nr:universal stress protein [Actinophytocola sp.]
MADDLVLIGFDGTPAAERAVRESAALFSSRPALVVTVWEPGRAFDLALIPARGLELPLSSVDIRTAAEADEAAYREAQQLARWGAQLANDGGLRAEALTVADERSVAGTLVALARERAAAVVVLGAHRHGRIAELLVGTTTRGVLQHAPCPTLVVRAD